MKKKVLCIGDSLALPGHLNSYEDTWFYKIKQEFPEYDFISFFKRQLTTDVLTTMGGGEKGVDKWPKGGDCYEAYLPDIIILQLGIVDCAPRLLTLNDRIVLKLLPGLFKRYYIKIIKRIRSRNVNNTLVPYERFKKNMINYLERICNKTYIIIISISFPDDKMIKKNKEILINVKRYNDYFYELSLNNKNVTLLEPLNPASYHFPIYQDGYHPNTKGHDIITNNLIRVIRELG